MSTMFEENQPLVLIADDDSNFRLLAKSALKTAGFRIEEAENGDQLLSLFKRTQANIILLDIIMPGRDGFTTCSKLRKLPGGEYVPILMITGMDDIECITRAYEAGATDFITKPVNWLILCHRVRFLHRTNQKINELIKKELEDLANLYALSDLLITESDQPLGYFRTECLKHFRALEKLVGAEIFGSIIQSYLTETPQQIQSLQNAVNNKNLETLRQETLQFKLKSSNLGAVKIVSLCKEIEAIDKPEHLHQALNFISDIEVEFFELKKLLEREQNRLSSQ